MRPQDFYDNLATNSAALATILEHECGPAVTTGILDCACGIGTQTLGLAKRGFRMTATDAIPSAVARARREAASRALSIEFSFANMLDLSQLPNARFGGAIGMDNPSLRSGTG